MTRIPLTSSAVEIRQVGRWLNNFRFLFVDRFSAESALLEYLIKRTFGFGKFQDRLHFSQLGGVTLSIGMPGFVESSERSIRRWRTNLCRSNLLLIQFCHNRPDIYIVNAPGMLEHLVKLWDARPTLIKNWQREARPLIQNVLSDMTSLDIKFPRVAFRREAVVALNERMLTAENDARKSRANRMEKTASKIDSASYYKNKKRNLRGKHVLDYFRTYCQDHDIPYTESVTAKLIGCATHFVTECEENGRTVSEYTAMICDNYRVYRTQLFAENGKQLNLSGVFSFDTYFKHRRAIDAWLLDNYWREKQHSSKWVEVD